MDINEKLVELQGSEVAYINSPGVPHIDNSTKESLDNREAVNPLDLGKGGVGWMALSIFLLFMVYLMSLFYSYSLIRLVDPAECAASGGEYGVRVGIRYDTAAGCSEGLCRFKALTLKDAVNICDLNPIQCEAFYYDGGFIDFMRLDSTEYPAEGGVYIRQNTVSIQGVV